MSRIKGFLPFLLLLLLAAPCLAEDGEVRCRVVDAQTRDAVAFASVYVSASKGTMCNEEGEFGLLLAEGDTVRVSCIGYRSARFAAAELPAEVRLERLPMTLREVSVVSSRSVLDKVARRFRADARHSSLGQYFCRTLEEFKGRRELIEAIVEAKNAGSLRDLAVTDGRRMQLRNYATSVSSLSKSNLHHILELGPGYIESFFWDCYATPLDGRNYKKFYTVETETLFDEDGRQLCRIRFRGPARPLGRVYLEGELLVDAETHAVLRYSGALPSMRVLVLGGAEVLTPVEVGGEFCINYRHTKGFAEVDNIHYEIKGDDFAARAVLFNVSGMGLRRGKARSMDDDLVAAVGDAGGDSAVWSLPQIVKRTKHEESLAFGCYTYAHTPRVDPYRPDTVAAGNARLAAFVARLAGNGPAQRQEKVYVHMDNTCYYLGDTIWFAAYTRDSPLRRPSDVSKLLYVELVNEEGNVVERKNIEMTHGRGNGFFALSDPYQYGGYYELRAYTRWQLNWGVFQHKHSLSARHWFLCKELERNYYRDYEKLYSRVFPVYDKPRAPGQYAPDMTRRPMMRRVKERAAQRGKPRVTLYPEGGSLVAGVRCRVAFEALWENGEWAEGTLAAGGDSARVVSRGRGSLWLTPGEGKAEAVFTARDGQVSRVALPRVARSGAALSVERADSGWTVVCRVTDDLAGDTLGLTLCCGGALEWYRDVTRGASSFTVPASSLLPGVSEACLFNACGEVLASRLFFSADTAWRGAPLRVTLPEGDCRPGERVEVAIECGGDTTAAAWQPVSVSVRDAAQPGQGSDNADIRAEMLLASEVRGFIPDPGWFFERDDAERREALDLLLLTQGWRRFRWRDMAVEGEWKATQPAEQTPILMGRIYKYDEMLDNSQFDSGVDERGNKHGEEADSDEADMKGTVTEAAPSPYDGPPDAVPTKKEFYVYSQLFHGDGEGRQQLKPQLTSEGRFALVMPRIQGVSMLLVGKEKEFLATKGKRAATHKWQMMAEGDTAFTRSHWLDNYRILVDVPYPRFVKPYEWHRTRSTDGLAWRGAARAREVRDSVSYLSEVTVGANAKGLRKFSDAFPSLCLAALEAENLLDDAGIRNLSGIESLGRALFGDMGLDFPYTTRFGAKSQLIRTARMRTRYGVNPVTRVAEGLDSVPADSVYHPRYLRSYDGGRSMSPGDRREYYSGPGALERLVVYTDYCPRLEGDERYNGANLPEVFFALYPYADGRKRPVFVDRCMAVSGFAPQAEFYSPDYGGRPLPEGREDYRRTLYWNPDVQLDENGSARLSFYNSSLARRLSVDAEGQGTEGQLLWGRER